MRYIVQKPSQLLHLAKKICTHQAQHYDLPQTACDYHKVGMSVKGRLVGTHRTYFHSHIFRSEVKGPL